MKIVFENLKPKDALSKLKKTLQGRQLGEIVSFELENSELRVVISKLGTSTLSFACEDENGDCVFQLSGEKIAFAHRAFKGEVMGKFVNVVEKSGGVVKIPYGG